MYAFFEPTHDIKYVNKQRLHVFKCLAKGCTKTVRRFLDKADVRSMGNLQKHVKLCWGDKVVEVDKTKNVIDARVGVVKTFQRSGSITSAFQCSAA